MHSKNRQNYLVSIEKRKIDLSEERIKQEDIHRISSDGYHILRDGLSIQAKVIDINQRTGVVILEHNNSIYRFQVETTLDHLVNSIQKSSSLKNQELVIKSNMPGLILDVLVNEGDTISEGQPVLIIEAMKMENVVKSKFDGLIKSIHCSKGEAIDKNQLLIECEPKTE